MCPDSPSDDTATQDLLLRWHGGDRAALEALMNRHLPWLNAHVEHRLGALLRNRAEVNDFVQEAVLEFLEYGPRFVIRGDAKFRGLLVRIVENMLRDKDDYYRARRRSRSVECPMPSDSMLLIDPPRVVVQSPSQEVQKVEEEAWIRLGLDLAPSEDRRIIALRDWERLSFAEIGERLKIAETAARMRYHRAVVRLSSLVVTMRTRGIEAALQDERNETVT